MSCGRIGAPRMSRRSNLAVALGRRSGLLALALWLVRGGARRSPARVPGPPGAGAHGLVRRAGNPFHGIVSGRQRPAGSHGVRRGGRRAHRPQRERDVVGLASGRRPPGRGGRAARHPTTTARGEEHRSRGARERPLHLRGQGLGARCRRQRALRLLPDARKPAAEVRFGGSRRRSHRVPPRARPARGRGENDLPAGEDALHTRGLRERTR